LFAMPVDAANLLLDILFDLSAQWLGEAHRPSIAVDCEPIPAITMTSEHTGH
jgi:hypothetical protein